MTNTIHLKTKSLQIRKQVLKMAVNAGAGHIAPSYSCIELLVSLYYGDFLRFNPQNPSWDDRDRFILSKGQAAAALYAILADTGFFPVSDLLTFTINGSRLGGHCEDNVPGVQCFTGSLGHGLPIGVGMAQAAKMDKKDYLTVVLMGDGECQEGSVWEAAMLASTLKLRNLITIIDRNGLQAIDFTEKVASLEPFTDKWKSFGWEVQTVDGHNIADILSLLKKIRSRDVKKPLTIIASTIKGKGISFMENKPIWHYRVPTGDELVLAQKELDI